jgi:hypothetical protein
MYTVRKYDKKTGHLIIDNENGGYYSIITKNK